jgi:hypothetical protein
MKVIRFFSSTFTPNQEKHRNVWSSIFRSSKWASIVVRKGLNPALLGYGLREPYNNTGKPAYIVLTTGDTKGGTYEEDLLDSLQPHDFNRSTMEVSFRDSNITLNISQPVCNRTFTTLPPRRLFSSAQELCSASLHWTDRHYELQEIRLEDIAGLDLNGYKDVSMICGLVVRDPEGPRTRQFQGCFQDLMCPPVNPTQCEAGFCLGWKLAQ